MALTPELLLRLTEIFERKQWPTKLERRSLDGARFEKFGKMLSLVEESEARLILELTENFEKYNSERTLLELSVALDLAGLNHITSAETIFVLPLVDQDEADKNKSGTAYSYHFLHNVLNPLLQQHNIEKPIYDYKIIRSIERHPDRGASLIFAIDDFIGSGSTAEKFIERYCKYCSTNNDKLLILSAAAMKSGIEEIEKTGHDVYTGTIYTRGISDSPCIPNIESALTLMDNIETLIDVEEGCNRGYRGGEALVSFTRTPDNTFPLYWSKKTKSGGEWPCPSPR